MEHSPIDWSQAATIFAAIADAGGVPLARVPKGNHDYIKRTLDAGAWGIVVPMVDTVEQAKIAIAAAKYPPIGNRSLGGGMHSLNFDCTGAEYFHRANDEILVVLQTESPTRRGQRRSDLQPAGRRRDLRRPGRSAGQLRKPDGSEASDEEFEAMLHASSPSARRPARPPACTSWIRARAGSRRARHAIHRHRQRAAVHDRARPRSCKP